ncbi:MAG: response regulator [Bacteroidia bacterium]
MSGKRVLVVEDDSMLSFMHKKILEKMGHKVVATVNCGEDAITAAKEHEPDIILMDLILKGRMDGVETMTTIGKFSPVPVIYLSGNSYEDYKERAAKTNMIAFCSKPVHIEGLQKYFSTL